MFTRRKAVPRYGSAALLLVLFGVAGEVASQDAPRRLRRAPQTVFSASIDPEASVVAQGVRVTAHANIFSRNRNRNLVWWLRVKGYRNQELGGERAYELQKAYHGRWFRLVAPCDRWYTLDETLDLPPGVYVISVGLCEQPLDPDTGKPLEKVGEAIAINSTDVEVPDP